MSKITPEQERAIDVLLTSALFRCFNEQLYSIKGSHSYALKLKFNRLVKVGRQYEAEIQRHYGKDPNIESIYDELMELILVVRTSIVKSIENGKPEVE